MAEQKPRLYGLTHECDDPACHVTGFVKTLRTMEHPTVDCGLLDCPSCVEGRLRILDSLTRPPHANDAEGGAMSGACTCNPYFGCSEYADDCPRHGTPPTTPHADDRNEES